MRGVWRFMSLLAVAGLLAAGLLACGDSDSGDSGADSTATTTRESPAKASPDGQGSGGEGSASFRSPGGDNSIQNYGEEADAAEVAEATTVLSAYLKARAEEDWAKQCALLSEATVAPLEQLASRSPQFKGKGCAAVLEGLMSRAPDASRVNTLTGPVDSLRVEADRGFALYHGAGGIDYFIPLAEEDGEWKIGAIAPSEFP